jgi:hypothetical protein
MILVVADTGPLHYLILIEAAGLLPRLYDRVVIPSAVLRELTHQKAPAAVKTWAAALPAWAEVKTASHAELDDILDPGVDSDQFGHLFQSISDSVPGYWDSCRSEARRRLAAYSVAHGAPLGMARMAVEFVAVGRSKFFNPQENGNQDQTPHARSC